MSEIRMDVVLLNQSQAGVDRQTLVHQLAAAFKTEASAIEQMLSQPRTVVKRNVDVLQAQTYKTAIENAGGLCELVPHLEQSLELNAVEPAPVADDIPGYCYKCGTVLNRHMQSCPTCFTPQVHSIKKNKTLAGFLAFFLGGFGLHRFYLGQWWGIFYIVFWLTLIPSLVSIVEAVVFWLTSDERWNKKYARVTKAGDTMMVIGIISSFLFVVLAGMLAAVALPAYQDYTIRSRIHSAMPLVNETRLTVTAFIKQTGIFPSQNLEAGLPDDIGNDVASIQLMAGGKIQVTYTIPNLIHSGNTIVWTPTLVDGEVNWTCIEGTLVDHYRNSECRGGTGALVKPKVKAKEAVLLSKRMFSDDNRFSIDVPKNWKEAPDLNEDASIGAKNIFVANFALVIAEPKEDFEEGFALSDYTQTIVALMEESITGAKTPGNLRQLDINGLPAEQLVLTGTVDNLKIGYVITTIESDWGFYQVITWTLLSNLKDRHPLLRSIGRSFVEHHQ